MQLRNYQLNAVKWICDQCERGQNPLFCCAIGGGKCFAAGTPVLMSDGNIKSIENIQISLLSPRYSTANLRKNEARALIFWDSWKKEITNKIKPPM